MSNIEKLIVTGIDNERVHLKAPDGRPLALKKTEMSSSHRSAIEIALGRGVQNWNDTAPAPIVLNAIVQKLPDGKYQSIQIAAISIIND